MATGVFSPECGVDLDYELPHVWADELLALDMDRTLVDSDKCGERLAIAAGRFGIDRAVILGDKEATESGGGTFQPMETVQKALTKDQFDEMAQWFMSGTAEGYTYTDTAPFLRSLGHSMVTPNLVITYGTSPVWQALKSYLSGYRGYVEVMGSPDKGEHIEGWRGPSGTFDFIGMNSQGKPAAIYHTESVRLVDDKAPAFTRIPADVTGALIQRPGARKLKQQGTRVDDAVADRVDTVKTLEEIRIRADQYAGCGHREIPQSDIVAFRPAYPNRPKQPGFNIRRDYRQFSAIRHELDIAYARLETV